MSRAESIDTALPEGERVADGPAAGSPRTGRLALTFARDHAGETYLGKQYAAHPFHICRTHTFADDPPGMRTLYLQSSSGGIYENDDLRASIVAEPGAKVHVTTQASTIVHSMPAGESLQRVEIEAGAESFVEYLPDAMILFPRSRMTTELHLRAASSACVVLADCFLLHDPYATGEVFNWLSSTTTIADESGKVVSRDPFLVEGRDLILNRPGVNGPYVAQGALTVYAPERDPEALVSTLRPEVESLPDVYAGVSLLPGNRGLWMRVLAADANALRLALHRTWAHARFALTGQWPAPRRK